MSDPAVLTPLQRELLSRLSRSPLADRFFLTGGTALAACYRRHRLSEDLDFFTETDGEVPRARPILEQAAHGLGGTLNVSRAFSHFLECAVEHPDGRVLIHVAQDAPYRLAPVTKDPDTGFPVDNELDIACNKLSALFDRAMGKDFTDIYFVHRESIPLGDLMPQAARKHPGAEGYWLAQSFQRVTKVEWLPRMLKPLTLDELKAFFLAEAARLAATLRPPGR